MDLELHIHIDEPFATLVDPNQIQGAVAAALDGVEGAVELGVVITDDDTMKKINRSYRGLNETTDVLSFALGQDEAFVLPPNGVRHLGEVIISYPEAVKGSGLARLIIHGVLHLLGYDHAQAAEEEKMRAREETALARIEGWRCGAQP